MFMLPTLCAPANRNALNHSRILLLITGCLFLSTVHVDAQDTIRISTPMVPPEWALLERELLDATSAAVSEFYEHFFDERGYLLHVARWGALDGTDDAIRKYH